MPLKINIRHLEEEPIHVRGELPAADLDLEHKDELIRLRQPLRYDITAERMGDSIFAHGKLALILDCECSRCLKPYEHRIELPQWAAHIPLEGPDKAELKDDMADLTPSVREDILLEFPQHPLCGTGCAGLPMRARVKETKSTSPAEGSSAWAELNKLKF